MSHHDDDLRHDDDAGLPGAQLDVVRRELAETRPAEPSPQAFARQADAIMAAIGAEQPEQAPTREPRPVAHPQRASWLDAVRSWWQNLGRVEVLAYAAMLAVLVGGLWAAASMLDDADLPAVPTTTTTTDEVAQGPDDAQVDDTAVAQRDDLEDLEDDALSTLQLGAIPDDSLEVLAELSVDDWSPDAGPGDETDWAELADEDDETLTVATALGADLDAGELARLERALSSDRSLFPR